MFHDWKGKRKNLYSVKVGCINFGYMNIVETKVYCYLLSNFH